MLAKLQYSNIEPNVLKAALKATTNSEIMQKQWDNYQKDFEYAVGITFMDACEAVLCS